jgi:trans-2,3-dihydro-3-hydroxyanthranilate isomerase
LLACAVSARGADYRYLHLDVFTDRALSGNQLAVFLEPESLTPEQMLAITREMAFSETTFVFPAEDSNTAFRVRIFANNLGREIAVAGHPTIGTVFALAHEGLIEAGTEEVVLGLGIGPTPVELEWNGDRLRFAWMHQRRPTFAGTIEDKARVASALGLSRDDVVDDLPVQEVSCGAPFLMVPLETRRAVDAASLDRAAMGALIDAHGLTRRGVFVFSLEPAEDDATLYSRMFGFGVIEDPATGNASGPVGSYLLHHGVVSADEARHLVSRQGVAMGRPSRVHIRVDGGPDDITAVRVGGGSVVVGEGAVRVP